jgi:cytochrome b561
MQQPTTTHRYSAAAKALHWSVAGLILVDFAYAISFSQFNPGDALYLGSAYAMHMSFGLTALFFAVLFVLRRLKVRHAKAVEDISEPSRTLARIVHALLYAFMIVVPFTGWVILSTRKQAANLIGSVNWPNIGFIVAMPKEQRVWWYQLCFPAHKGLAYIGMSLVGLHFMAALYHHFYRHDGVLKRMLPRFTSPAGRPPMTSQNVDADST